MITRIPQGSGSPCTCAPLAERWAGTAGVPKADGPARHWSKVHPPKIVAASAISSPGRAEDQHAYHRFWGPFKSAASAAQVMFTPKQTPHALPKVEQRMVSGRRFA